MLTIPVPVYLALGRDCVLLAREWLSHQDAAPLYHHGRVPEDEVDRARYLALPVELAVHVRVQVAVEAAPVEH